MEENFMDDVIDYILENYESEEPFQIYDHINKKYYKVDKGELFEISMDDVVIEEVLITTESVFPKMRCVNGIILEEVEFLETISENEEVCVFEGKIYRVLLTNPSKKLMDNLEIIEKSTEIVHNMFAKRELTSDNENGILNAYNYSSSIH